jgi:alpha-L-rhamnosidase
MTSFNHYALGAIADWLHRIVAGLAPAEAGYRKLEIAPQPLPGLDWASTRHETPYGTAEVAWRRSGDQIVVSASVPANSSAVVRLPAVEPFTVTAGTFEWTVADTAAEAAAGPVTTSSPLAEIMDDPEAYEAVMAAFRRVSPVLAMEFTKRTAWLPNEPLIGGFTLISPAVAAEMESGLAALNESRGH